MPHRDILRFAEMIPAIRAQYIVAMSEAFRFGMADLKDDSKAIAAWDRLNRIANSRPVFPSKSSPGTRSEEEIAANFNRDLWLAQMAESGIGLPAHLFEAD